MIIAENMSLSDQYIQLLSEVLCCIGWLKGGKKYTKLFICVNSWAWLISHTNLVPQDTLQIPWQVVVVVVVMPPLAFEEMPLLALFSCTHQHRNKQISFKHKWSHISNSVNMVLVLVFVTSKPSAHWMGKLTLLRILLTCSVKETIIQHICF